MNRFITLFLGALLIASLSGCASVPMGDPYQDWALKQFVPKESVAGLYVYRNDSFGGGRGISIDVDGQFVGQTAAKRYLYAELTPGVHTVTAFADNVDTLQLDVRAGKLYYVWLEGRRGIRMPRAKLHAVNEVEGKNGVLRSKLAALTGPQRAARRQDSRRYATPAPAPAPAATMATPAAPPPTAQPVILNGVLYVPEQAPSAAPVR